VLTRKFVVLLTATIILSGCSASLREDAPSTTEQGKTGAHVSRAKDYRTMAELKADSTAIIVGTAGASTVQEVDGIQFTVTDVRVSKVLWGKAASQVVAIKQLGGPELLSADTSRILASGSEYIAFVQPFHMTPGDTTGQYLVTGDRGLYKLDRKTRQYAFEGGSESSLPLQIPAESATPSEFMSWLPKAS